MLDKMILKTITILYVEDEEDIRNVTQNILNNFVDTLIVAQDGQEGLDIFKEYNIDRKTNKHFDIILTDINMPKLNGLDMIEQIRQYDTDIPVIITTAHGDVDFLRRSIELKVQGYISKPLNLSTLLDNIIYALEPKFLRKELLKANETLEKQVEEKTIELRYILNSQKNLIFVVNDNKVSNMNKTMLDFLGLESLDQFYEKHICINRLFLKEDGYFHCEDNEEWILRMQNLDPIDKIVKMYNIDNDIKYFQVNISNFFYNTEHYVVSFTDITELRKYTTLLNYQATHDNLTSLFNRQKLHNHLDTEIQRQQRYKREFALIMFDIDNFKNINDTYGHDVGDIVLKVLSNIAKDSTRSTDIVSRWGGEEFMILLPETSLDDAINIANKIRTTIQAYKFEQIEHFITISLGVTTFKIEDDTKEQLLKRVDIALYKAKENGKNQTVTI